MRRGRVSILHPLFDGSDDGRVPNNNSFVKPREKWASGDREFVGRVWEQIAWLLMNPNLSWVAMVVVVHWEVTRTKVEKKVIGVVEE